MTRDRRRRPPYMRRDRLGIVCTVWLTVFGALAGAAVVLSARSSADPINPDVAVYAAKNAGPVCSTLDSVSVDPRFTGCAGGCRRGRVHSCGVGADRCFSCAGEVPSVSAVVGAVRQAVRAAGVDCRGDGVTGRKINPDVRALRGHSCHYETPDTPKTDAPDYTNCSGALADLGDDE